jgi:hypothetical protein
MAIRSRRSLGFSIVEMAVAMLFIGLLMAGMMRIYGLSVRSFYTGQETLGAQRMNRLAFDQLTEDIQQAGYLFPLRAMPGHVLAGTQTFFEIRPAQTVSFKRPADAGAGATEDESVTADEIILLRDVPLVYHATLGMDVAEASRGATLEYGVTLSPQPGSVDQVRKGDLMVTMDSTSEAVVLAKDLAANKAEFDPAGASADAAAGGGATGLAPTLMKAHYAGASVMFVRPLQLIRYSIQPIALDPANPSVSLPCLVRQQADFPVTGTVDWTKVAGTVMAENVSGLRLDMSVDGGETWSRAGAATWNDMKGKLETRLAAVGRPSYKSLSDTSGGAWFRNVGALLRADITTRTSLRRTEYDNASATPARTWRERTLTLLMTPRNFALGN